MRIAIQHVGLAAFIGIAVLCVFGATSRPALALTSDSTTLFLGASNTSDVGPSNAADIVFSKGQSIVGSGRVQFYFLKNLISSSSYHHLETGYAYTGGSNYQWFTEIWGWSTSGVSCPQEIARSGSHVDLSPVIRQCWGAPSDSYLGADGTAHYFRHINAFSQWGAQACGSTNPGTSSTGCMNIGQVPTGGLDTPTEVTVLLESNGPSSSPVDTSDLIKGNFISLERFDTSISAYREVNHASAVVTGFYTSGAGYRDWPTSPHTTLCPPWGFVTNVFSNYHWFGVGNWPNTTCLADGTAIW
jgi:hypothetical protein